MLISASMADRLAAFPVCSEMNYGASPCMSSEPSSQIKASALHYVTIGVLHLDDLWPASRDSVGDWGSVPHFGM